MRNEKIIDYFFAGVVFLITVFLVAVALVAFGLAAGSGVAFLATGASSALLQLHMHGGPSGPTGPIGPAGPRPPPPGPSSAIFNKSW